MVFCGDNRGHICGFLVFWLQITIEFQHSVCDDMYVYRDVSQKRSVCRPSMCLSCVCNLELLCHLLVILKVIFANSVDPDQTAPL